LRFLTVPGGSPPSLVRCVAWHGPGRGLAPSWLACAAIAAAPPSPGNPYCFFYLLFSIYTFSIYAYCRQCMLLLRCLSCGRACCATAFVVVLVVHVMLLCYFLCYAAVHAMLYS
jgi:hypothetical protein